MKDGCVFYFPTLFLMSGLPIKVSWEKKGLAHGPVLPGLALARSFFRKGRKEDVDWGFVKQWSGI
jgi:hypothetical protein